MDLLWPCLKHRAHPPNVISRLADIETIKRLLLTLAVGGAGGLAFFLIGLPAAWLSGPSVTVAAGVLGGIRLAIPNWLRHTAFIVLGASMGSAMTPETLELLSRWPASLAGLAICVIAIMGCCSLYLQKVHSYDRDTARLASVPGALPYVLALAAEGRGDPSRVAIIQVFRLAVLLVCMPSALAYLGTAPASVRHAAEHPVVLIEIAALLAGAAVTAYLFTKIKAPAPTLFGPMIAGAVLYASGILSSGIPMWLMTPCFLVVGCTVGTNFVGISRSDIAEAFLASLGSLIVGMVIAILCAVTVAWIVDLPAAQLWLAYSPGGVDVMTVIALVLGYDTAFVGGHHVARFLGLGLFLPLWLRRS